MIKIDFEINGRSVDSSDIKNVLITAMIDQLKEQIHSKLAGIRDPETGEFPTVAIRGNSLENLSLQVNGSKKLIEIVTRRLGNDFGMANQAGDLPINNEEAEMQRPPVAFLSYASENKKLATRIAEDFQKQGIKTFFDEWEIGPGDSIRTKIDEGLGNCTHFVVLLTPESIEKKWVNTEIDAAFVAKVAGHCKFIPLRSSLPVERLSPLLRGLHAPALENYDSDIHEVIDSIYEISKKPSLGPPPPAASRAVGKIGLSAAAEAIVRLFIERSENGCKFDPIFGPDAVRRETGLGDDDIIDAVDELEALGVVERSRTLSDNSIGFTAIYPEGLLFSEFDQHFKDWSPAADARRIRSRFAQWQQ